MRPTVQGAAVVLENQTGRILAMAGGFSYPLSQLNRVTQSQRQPGSAIKPLTYLAALAKGLQPNTLVRDEPLTLPPIGGTNARTRAEDYWTPKNYDGGGGGIMTLRRALENCRAISRPPTCSMGGIDVTPALSLDRICALAMEAQIYRECVRYYPFVLGAQPVRPIDLAAFFAAIANEGVRPAPHVIESIEQDGKVIYRHPADVRGPDRLGRRRRLLPAQDDPAGRPAARHRHAASPGSRPMSPARPAPPTARTTPGSSASPTRSRWRSGSATTMPTAGAARSAAARPAAASRCRSSSRSSRRCGRTMRRARRCGDRRPKPGSTWSRPGSTPISTTAPRLYARRRRRGTPGTLVEYLRRDARGQPVDTQYRLVSRDDHRSDVHGPARRPRLDRSSSSSAAAAVASPTVGQSRPSPSPPAFGQNAPRPQPQPYQRPLWRRDYGLMASRGLGAVALLAGLASFAAGGARRRNSRSSRRRPSRSCRSRS